MKKQENELKFEEKEINVESKSKFEKIYVFYDTDIFDEELDQKFRKILLSDMDTYCKEKSFKLVVKFHVNLLKDQRFLDFYTPPKPYNKNKNNIKIEEKIGEVLTFQIEKIREVLNENRFEVYTSSIQGDILEKENIIKIEISEDLSLPQFNGRGKSKNRCKVCSIVPNFPYTQDLVTKLASERINKLYYELINIIGNETMAKILEIKLTKDFDLFTEFAKQYGDLWLCTKDREKELLEKLKEKILAVFQEIEEFK